MNVLVTGGTGFIGTHIVDELLNDGSFTVTLLKRRTSSLRFVDKNRVDIVNIEDEEAFNRSFKKADYLIHNAFIASDWAERELFEESLLFTKRVVKKAKEYGVKRVILTGTNSVYGEEHCKDIKSELSPYRPTYNYFLNKILPSRMNWYREYKTEASRWAIEFAKKNSMNLIVLDPVWVYGPREFNTGFYEYLKSVKDGMFFTPGCKKNLFHLVYVKDLVKAYTLALKSSVNGVERFIIGNDEAPNMDEFYSLYLKHAGFRRFAYIPWFLIYPAGFLLELFYTLFKIKKAPLLTRGRINMFYDTIRYNTSKSRRILGFKQNYSIEEGIKESVEWYKKRGYL